jgi:ATP-binding cassette, subfamily F, member 3
VLSGGERSRLAMAVMILQPFNLLILDEPTNHLDMRSKDILKNALLQYDGTLIVVSHDREFLDGLVDKVYEFRHKGIREYAGGIFEFLEKRKISSIREIERKAVPERGNAGTGKAKGKGNNGMRSGEKSPGKGRAERTMSYEEKKEFDRKVRKAERLVHDFETKIGKKEAELKEMDEKMADPGNIDDQSMFFSYDQRRKELDRLMADWELASAQLESLKGD